MRRETEAQIDILSEIVDDNEEAKAYITGMEWMITTKWIRSILWGGAATIDRTNIYYGEEWVEATNGSDLYYGEWEGVTATIERTNVLRIDYGEEW